jgi:murein DD-endopeptidase MepM/ murein hydrolase activator NlpD
MHKSLTIRRRRARALRRGQLRRRRAVALVVLVTLIVLAVWAAYAIPAQTPARIPASAALPTLGESPSSPEDLVVARLEGVEVLMPVPLEASTAVAYHSVDNANTVPFSPTGDRLSGGSIGERLGDIFAGGGELRYYLMEGDGDDVSSSTSGLDIGAVPGSPVTSPVSGKVIAVKKYSILGRYDDVEVDLQVADDPSLVLMITHLAKPRVEIGDTVRAGNSTLGVVRGFPAALDQALSRYTSDTGDHLQLVALRVTPGIAGL